MDNTLGVVIPVMNEPEWLPRALGQLRRSAEEAGLGLDVVIVDDGSRDTTYAVADRLAEADDVRVVHQENLGRFAARLAGLREVRADDVLMLDARVLIDTSALAHMRAERERDPELTVWVGHVESDVEENPYSAFWSGLAKVFWRRYFADPKPTSFGADVFDAYPKGTGAFLAPRALLLEAAEAFESMYDEEHLSSDDTRWLREVATRHPIRVDPRFVFRYHGRSTLRRWLGQGYFRGTTFVDGYLGDASRAPMALGAVGVATTGAVVMAARRPLTSLAAVGAGCLAAREVVRRSGGTPEEQRAVATMVPAFVPPFLAGVIRGLILALRAR